MEEETNNESHQMTQKEQCDLARDLCRRIDAAPEYIYDSALMVSEHRFRIDELKFERFLVHHGYSVRIYEKNLFEAVKRIYGDEIASIFKQLL